MSQVLCRRLGWANLTASTPETRTTLGESDRARRTDDKIWVKQYFSLINLTRGNAGSGFSDGNFTGNQSGDNVTLNSSCRPVITKLAAGGFQAGGLHCKAVR